MDGKTHCTSPHTPLRELRVFFFFSTNFHPIKIDYDKNRPRGGEWGDCSPLLYLARGESYESNTSCVGNHYILVHRSIN